MQLLSSTVSENLIFVVYSFQCFSYFQIMGWSHLGLLQVFHKLSQMPMPSSHVFEVLTFWYLWAMLVPFFSSPQSGPAFWISWHPSLSSFLFSHFNPSCFLHLALPFWIMSSVYTPFFLFPTHSNFPEIQYQHTLVLCQKSFTKLAEMKTPWIFFTLPSAQPLLVLLLSKWPVYLNRIDWPLFASLRGS